MSPNELFQKSIRFSWASGTTKCASERPKCRKMCVPKILSRNRRENVLVLEKQWATMWADHFEELGTPSENTQFDSDFLTRVTTNVQESLLPALMTHLECSVDLSNMRKLHEFVHS